MKTGHGFRRRAARSLAVALGAVCAIAAPAAAMSSKPNGGELSPRLAELAKPSVRTAPPAKQAAILDVAPEGQPGSLLRQGSRVLVDVRFDHGAAASLDDLRAAGAQIVHLSRQYQTVTAAVPPTSLHDVAGVARVQGVTEDLAPIVYGAGDPGPIASTVTPCFGATTSEGDTQLNAMAARDAFGVDGSGVTVGILSDSFDKDSSAPTHAAQDVAFGDLPGPGNPCGDSTPVKVLDDFTPSLPSDPPPEDEGRAMAQIVHDLAPGASIDFATAFDGETQFADNIRALAAAGAKVIVDDISYFDEPFFQDGPVAVAVNDVTAGGVAYFSSAGNNNLIAGGKNIASWETPQFRDGGGPSICPPALTSALPYVTDCLDFNPTAATDGNFSIVVQPGKTLTVDLQWAQPWNGVTTDLDAYLLDASNTVVAGSENDNVNSTGQPVEVFSWTNDSSSSQTVRLSIDRCGPSCNPAADNGSPRLKFVLMENGSGVTSTEYQQSAPPDIVGPTIFGHNGAEDAMSVGAIRHNATPPESPSTWAPEVFSSRGPVTHYFGPVQGTTPAAPLGSPKVLPKPDVVATDGGANTFFGTCAPDDVWRFFGTSASAPHAAAIAALEFQKVPGATPAAVKKAQIDTAQPVGSFAPDSVGTGMVDGISAIGQLLGTGSPGGTQFAQLLSPNCGQSSPPPPPTPVAPDTSTPNPPVPTGDSVAPQTSFALRPAKLVLTRTMSARVGFQFKSSESDSSFRCDVDSERFRLCGMTSVRSFPVGRHVVRVKARDAAGNVDPTPAVYRFRVERIG